jgi:hypothetical protein
MTARTTVLRLAATAHLAGRHGMLRSCVVYTYKEVIVGNNTANTLMLCQKCDASK